LRAKQDKLPLPTATGFILMEHVRGTDIEDYLRSTPEKVNEVFAQTAFTLFASAIFSSS
jgi:hypothetical protein